MSRPKQLGILGALVLTALFLGCGHTHTPAVPLSRPTARPYKSTKKDATPPRRARAVKYDSSAPVQLSEREETIFKQLFNRLPELSRIKLDGTLCAAARLHATDLTVTRIDSDEVMDYLRHALRWAGNADYVVTPAVFDLSKQGQHNALRFLSTALDSSTHLGIGLAGSGNNEKLVFITTRRLLRFMPIPVSPVIGDTLRIRGALTQGQTQGITVFLEEPDGRIRQIPTFTVGGRQFTATIPVERKGRHILELQATLPTGPETASLMELYVETPAPTTPVVVPAYPEAESAPVPILLTLINKTRQKAGLSPLVLDKRLNKVAREHSTDIINNGIFGHNTPQGGPLSKRLARAGLHPVQTGENIARSNRVMRAHHNLMASPSHKSRILDGTYTHLGIGVSRRDGDVVVTEIFAQW